MIRILHEHDFPQLLAIEQLTQEAPWTLETFQRCWQAGYLGWVVERDDVVAGFVIVSIQAGESHILNLGVHPHFQRQGWGEQLMRHTLTAARNKGVELIFLEVRMSNKPAITLYEKLGFVQIGERKAYYPTQHGREDALVWAKDLRI